MSMTSFKNWPARSRLRYERRGGVGYAFARRNGHSPAREAGAERAEASFHSQPSFWSRARLADPAMPAWKRTLDVCGAAAALLVLAPVMALIAVGIKLVSPGPVFFRQARVGNKGRTFTCYKFRSMKVETDTDIHRSHLERLMSSSEPMTKLDMKSDPRLIPFGRLIRSSALDELPQLFNILLGDMSLVGPRPCIPYEYVGYTDEQKRRVLAYPGMTGLWQVSGKNRTTFEEMVDLDIRYAQTKSLWMDLSILIRTPLVLITQIFDLTREAPQQQDILKGVKLCKSK